MKFDEKHSKIVISALKIPKTKIELPAKSYVDKKSNDPRIIKKTAHIDFNDKNIDNGRFVKMNSMPAVRGHLTPKHYVDQAIF